MFTQHPNAKTTVRFWAECPEHRTLDNFEQYLRDIGNEVYEVDAENSRILIGEVEA